MSVYAMCVVLAELYCPSLDICIEYAGASVVATQYDVDVFRFNFLWLLFYCKRFIIIIYLFRFYFSCCALIVWVCMCVGCVWRMCGHLFSYLFISIFYLSKFFVTRQTERENPNINALAPNRSNGRSSIEYGQCKLRVIQTNQSPNWLRLHTFEWIDDCDDVNGDEKKIGQNKQNTISSIATSVDDSIYEHTQTRAQTSSVESHNY